MFMLYFKYSVCKENASEYKSCASDIHDSWGRKQIPSQTIDFQTFKFSFLDAVNWTNTKNFCVWKIFNRQSYLNNLLWAFKLVYNSSSDH